MRVAALSYSCCPLKCFSVEIGVYHSVRPSKTSPYWSNRRLLYVTLVPSNTGDENDLRAMRQELDTPEFAVMKLKHDGELASAPVVDPLLGHCYPDEARKTRYCSGSSWNFLNQLILRRTAGSEDVNRWDTSPNNLTLAAQRPRCVCCRAAADGQAQNYQFVLHHLKFDQGNLSFIPSRETS